MADPEIQVKSLLVDIECELRVLGLWEDEAPSAEALASIEPFAVDTLSFSQWLQFIFVPKLYFIIEQKITGHHLEALLKKVSEKDIIQHTIYG